MTAPGMTPPGSIEPNSPEPGWYPDGVTPGVERWFDGVAWQAATRPTGAPTPPWGHDAPQPWGSGYPQPGYPQPGYPPPGYPQQAYPQQAYPQPVGYPPPWGAGYYGPPPTPTGSDPSDPMHWILPVGRSWQSILAGYLGLIALVVWILGPVAVGFGIWALRKASDGGHGRGRAWFGIVTGVLGTAFLIWFLIARA